MGAEERGKLLATHTAAALSKSSPPRSSYPSVENTGGAVARPHPGGRLPPTDEGFPKRLSRKTVVAFPQKVLPPPQAGGSDSEAQRHKVTSTSSSSSSSSSSDSDSDGEERDSDIGTQVASKGKAGFSKPEASRPLKNGAPKVTASAKEKSKVQKPHTDVAYPEKSLQPKKKGTFTTLVEDSKETSSKPMTSRPQSSEILEQNMKEERQRGKPRPDKTGKESRKPLEAEGILPGHRKARASTQPTSGPVPTTQTREASSEHPLATASRAGARHLEPEVPEPRRKTTSPLVRKESLGKQVPEGCSQTGEETLEDQKPVRYSKTMPAQEKDTLEASAGPQLEGRFQVAVGEAPPTDADPSQEAPADTQEPELTDTTTYKNLQHHDYNTYTFLDLNLDLSKFRLPQPSSGRESPRH